MSCLPLLSRLIPPGPVELIRCLVVAGLLLSCSAQAEVSAVATVKPLQHILAALTARPADAGLIMDNNQDPHHLVLRPSDRKKLADATLLVWTGPALELPLQKIIGQQAGHAEIIAMQELDGMQTILLAGQTDPHLWLDTDNAAVLARAISAALIRIDPQQQAVYRQRLETFLLALQTTSQEIELLLAPVAGQAWAVEHHAYRYFARRFGLAEPATLQDSDNNEPGLRSVLQFREAMQQQRLGCILSEPESNPQQLRELLDSPDLRIGTADILGQTIPVSAESYQQLMLSLAAVISQCAGDRHE